jgi:hypothetical protein
MAIAYTNHGAAVTSSTAATTTGAISVTAAITDTIIVAICLTTTAEPNLGVSDNTGLNAWTPLSGPDTNTDTIWTFYISPFDSTLVAAPTSITVSWSVSGTSSRYSCAIDTWSGVTGFGITNVATGTSTAPSVSLVGMAATSWLFSNMLSAHTTATWSATTGNLRQHIAGASTSTPGAAFMDLPATSGTVVTAALSLSKAWVARAVELQGATFVRPRNVTVLQAVKRLGTF